MFGFSPKAPVGAKERDWIETSLIHLRDVLSHERLQNATVILPTPDFFPGEWDGTEQAVERLLNSVCNYMAVDRARLQIAFLLDDAEELKQKLPYWAGSSTGAAGLYARREGQEKIMIAVKLTRRSEPDSVVATLAHELAHVLLLADAQMPRDAEDMEPLTDLATVFCGLGIFTANSAARFTQFDDGVQHGWSFQRQGYLSEQMFGYALAYFAQLRGESRPAWAKYLNINVGTYFKQSAKFLAKQSDALT